MDMAMQNLKDFISVSFTKKIYVEQLFPWSIVAKSIQSSIGNTNVFVPPENMIA